MTEPVLLRRRFPARDRDLAAVYAPDPRARKGGMSEKTAAQSSSIIFSRCIAEAGTPPAIVERIAVEFGGGY